jgi:hypothetical protein
MLLLQRIFPEKSKNVIMSTCVNSRICTKQIYELKTAMLMAAAAGGSRFTCLRGFGHGRRTLR